MADYFELWSATINNLTEEEFKWLDATLAKITRAVKEEEPSPLPSFLSDAEIEEVEVDVVPDIRLRDTERDRSAWFRSDGQTGEQLDVHAAIIKRFLRQFRPDQWFEIHWAAGCSRPIANDAYGGGCVFITAQHAVFMTTWDWARHQQANLGPGGSL